MLRAMILAVCVTTLVTLCLGEGRDKPSPQKTVTQGPLPATKAVPKTAGKPVIEPSKPAVITPATKSAERQPGVASPATLSRSSDEEAIRATGNSFEKAYLDADAKLLAAHFTADAEYIDEQGNVYQGREAIEKVMTACFVGKPVCQMELNIDSIRFISPGVAVEDGTTTVTPGDGSTPISSRYTAVHVKTAGKWLAASVRDHAPKGRRQHRAQLEQLSWLQGDWVDEGDESLVIFSCETVDDGNFLLRKFVIQVAGQEAMSGTQRIGWNPLTGKLQAWIFDSEGGHAEGFWHRDDDRWVLKSTGVTADGQPASSTSIYTLVNDYTMTWQSVDHEVGGVQLPDSELVTIVRRAPSPEMADDDRASKMK